MHLIFLVAFIAFAFGIEAGQHSFSATDHFAPPPSQNAINWWSALMDSTRDAFYSKTTMISNSVFFASIPAGTFMYSVQETDSESGDRNLSKTVWFTATPSGVVETLSRLHGTKPPILRVYRVKQDLNNVLWFPGTTNLIDLYEGPLKMIADAASDDTVGVARKFCEVPGSQGWAMNTASSLQWMLCNQNGILESSLHLVSESRELHRAYLYPSGMNSVSPFEHMTIHLGLAVLMDKLFRPNHEGSNKPTLSENIKLQFRQYWYDVFVNERCQDDRSNPKLVAIEQQMLHNWIEHGTRWRNLFSMNSFCKSKETLISRYQCFVAQYHAALLPFGVGEVPRNPSSNDLRKIEDQCRSYHRHLVLERPDDTRCPLTAMTYASIRGAFDEIAPWICRLALQAIDWNLESVLKSKDERAMTVTLQRMEDIKKQWEDAFVVKQQQ